LPHGAWYGVVWRGRVQGTTAQALADYANLIKVIKAEYSTNAPVIAFGGSYGGMLAGWFRIAYPEVIAGSIVRRPSNVLVRDHNVCTCHYSTFHFPLSKFQLYNFPTFQLSNFSTFHFPLSNSSNASKSSNAFNFYISLSTFMFSPRSLSIELLLGSRLL
jgi:pimeloyl-ACP methyl ester carboxylesterase